MSIVHQELEKYNHKELLTFYRSLLLIRRVEEAIAERYAEQEMRCPTHLCIGQEAVAVGVCEMLQQNDGIFSSHRAHSHYLAKGGSLKAMIAELYGKSTGCCGGRGGSMHLIDLAAGFIGATPIVGSTIPIAVGHAWSTYLCSKDRVTVVFFGDGCFEEGVMHESMNFASLYKLPIVFVCENNGYSVYTRFEARQPKRSIRGIAHAHGLDIYHGDGNDVLNVAALARDAVKRTRQGKGPQFIELDTYRWLEHCGPNDDDALGYRPAGELMSWKKRCPVEYFRNLLLEQVTDNDIQQIENDILHEIEIAFSYALESPNPTSALMADKVYAN
jgi:pyruvate dehydrogenase E1 component alpha subunit